VATREHWDIDDQFGRQLGTASYAAVVRRRWSVFAALVRQFCGTRVPRTPLCVLDAGCGDGINLVGLRQILTEIDVPFRLVGVDISAVRIERARLARATSAGLVRGSVSALPFASGSFDLVLCNHVLEHVRAPIAAVTEITRVLRHDGLAIIGVPNEGAILARVRNHVFQRSVLRSTDHVSFFTRRTLCRLLERGGLAPTYVRALGFFLPHLRLSALVSASAAGRRALSAAGRLLPSQAADLIVAAAPMGEAFGPGARTLQR
jgi:SAM-dependent methyltransferase